jgi:hypothetical protein
MAIMGGMLSATAFKSDQFYGSWGVEPTPEVERAWDGYVALRNLPTAYKRTSTKKLVRASSPVTIHDSILDRDVRAVKVELIEEFEPEAKLSPRRSIIIIGYAGEQIVRWFYAGRGPKEYREAF